MRWLGATALVVLLLGACTSPEATRSRGAGAGADVRNVRGDEVELHAGSEPYWSTPRLVDAGRPMPAASPSPAQAEPAKTAPAKKDAGKRS